MPARDDEERNVQSFPVSLSSAQITEAVSRSTDGGITLFLSKLGLSDIAAHEATELAIAGRIGHQENESFVERYTGFFRFSFAPLTFGQTGIGKQSFDNPADRVCPSYTPSLPESQTQLLHLFPRSRKSLRLRKEDLTE